MTEAEPSGADPAETLRPGGRASRWAWGICWLMFASTVLNYMDRQTISLVKKEISQAFTITSDADFGWILASFGMSYAIFQVPAGFLVDRWNLRGSFVGAVAFWSLAAIATAFAPDVGTLIVFRALLGIGESFNWPCALRVTARILPPADRGLGNGIFNSGAAVGAVVTPLVVTGLMLISSWRTAFAVIGAMGFVWVGFWLALTRGPEGVLLRAQPRLAEESDRSRRPQRLPNPVYGAFAFVFAAAAVVASLSYWRGMSMIWIGIAVAMLGPLAVAAAFRPEDLGGARWAAGLGEIVRLRRFWVMLVVAVSINICWHFLVNWIPTVLKEQRGLNFMTGNLLTTIPFLAADAGNIGGGWLSRSLAARGFSPAGARLRVMTLCAAPIIAGTYVGLAADNFTAVLLLSIMAAGTAAFMANYFTFAQEVSERHTGLVVGYLGGIGNLFVAGFHPFAGTVKDVTGSFSLIFVLIGIAPLLGLAALAWGWKESNEERLVSAG